MIQWKDVESGVVQDLFRYPVEWISNGLRLSEVDIGAHGVIGVAPMHCVRPMVAAWPPKWSDISGSARVMTHRLRPEHWPHSTSPCRMAGPYRRRPDASAMLSAVLGRPVVVNVRRATSPAMRRSIRPRSLAMCQLRTCCRDAPRQRCRIVRAAAGYVLRLGKHSRLGEWDARPPALVDRPPMCGSIPPLSPEHFGRDGSRR